MDIKIRMLLMIGLTTELKYRVAYDEFGYILMGQDEYKLAS